MKKIVIALVLFLLVTTGVYARVNVNGSLDVLGAYTLDTTLEETATSAIFVGENINTTFILTTTDNGGAGSADAQADWWIDASNDGTTWATSLDVVLDASGQATTSGTIPVNPASGVTNRNVVYFDEQFTAQYVRWGVKCGGTGCDIDDTITVNATMMYQK